MAQRRAPQQQLSSTHLAHVVAARGGDRFVDEVLTADAGKQTLQLLQKSLKTNNVKRGRRFTFNSFAAPLVKSICSNNFNGLSEITVIRATRSLVFTQKDFDIGGQVIAKR